MSETSTQQSALSSQPEPELPSLGDALIAAWVRYYNLFGDVPHGTDKQLRALAELVPAYAAANQNPALVEALEALRQKCKKPGCGHAFLCCEQYNHINIVEHEDSCPIRKAQAALRPTPGAV